MFVPWAVQQGIVRLEQITPKAMKKYRNERLDGKIRGMTKDNISFTRPVAGKTTVHREENAVKRLIHGLTPDELLLRIYVPTKLLLSDFTSPKTS